MVWLFVTVVTEDGKEARVDTSRVEHCRQGKVEQGRKLSGLIQGRDSVIFIELMGGYALNNGGSKSC